MAMSCGLFSTFLTGDTALLGSGPSSSSLKLAHPQSSANLRMVRAVTSATVSQQPTGKQPRGIMKPRKVSPEMQALVGVPEIPRTEALKRIWAYIKEHNLQDPGNKKIIICDEKLKKIFGGKDRVGFLEIAGLITPHFLK
ncbi:upstream activation factor subunit spp27-like [Quillaja saponaria]|uniref:Upstream activation factor subunit spp27-like n=1 Tax=Quillaja saponaria TaxID=32244 RepID=A0AAD7PU51_QUISA|nr:upstream activation factor subunit spp27-like [Quillaja saponaria]